MSEEKITLEFIGKKIDVSNGCAYCPLNEEISDGMSTRNYCLFLEEVTYMNEPPVSCRLSDEEKQEVQGREFVSHLYIK